MKVVKLDDIIEFCEAQVSYLYANHETVALSQLRSIKEFAKDFSFEIDNYAEYNNSEED